ncbi:MAG: sigma-70 family RNA polymerase sigma factor [Candidatus Viridilinea halotolerans]|uniref:Sigma-70 family RNA polymerase sigma factor n=1 Tax=Candidatus Viridilinea halotolerans TaxID=2491704 RepID=A0A426TRY9_9CHLR|nr:MAG: sigma-70 family RNA polymerase sigma factor [Candidatus Viridilinea halotolerans]
MAFASEPSDMAACRQTIRMSAQQYGWQLDALTCERYVRVLTPLLAAALPERRPLIVLHYHLDHRTVAALSDANHPAHHDTWLQWSQRALGVLRSAGVAWSYDRLLTIDDLAQLALGDLVQALPSYRYQSRLLSWAYSVIVRSAHRHLRAAHAQRRCGPSLPLDELTVPPSVVTRQAHHEEVAHARLLATHVERVLAAQSDPRLLTIFQLWAVEEYTSAEIGALVNLHESRVRALLTLARRVLRTDPTIKQWRASADDCHVAS